MKPEVFRKAPEKVKELEERLGFTLDETKEPYEDGLCEMCDHNIACYDLIDGEKHDDGEQCEEFEWWITSHVKKCPKFKTYDATRLHERDERT